MAKIFFGEFFFGKNICFGEINSPQIFFCKIFLANFFSVEKNIFCEKFSYAKQLCTKNFFFCKNFFWQNIFFDGIFFWQNFFWQNIFGQQFIFFQKNSMAKFFLQNIFFAKFFRQTFFSANIFWIHFFRWNFEFGKFFWSKILFSATFLGGLYFLKMSLWQLGYVQKGPRNLPLKFGQIRASNS